MRLLVILQELSSSQLLSAFPNSTTGVSCFRPLVETAWYWYRDRNVDQWNRTEDPEIKPHTCHHLIFDKETKNIQWKKESICNKWCCYNWLSVCKTMKIAPYLSPCTKLKSKWIKDLNIEPDTLNLIEEKVGKSLELSGTGGNS